MATREELQAQLALLKQEEADLQQRDQATAEQLQAQSQVVPEPEPVQDLAAEQAANAVYQEKLRVYGH